MKYMFTIQLKRKLRVYYSIYELYDSKKSYNFED